jgi:hypothetical protein
MLQGKIAIYASMIHTVPCIMFLMPVYLLLGQGGGVGPLNGSRLSARCHFTGPKKLSTSSAQPPLK